MAAPVSGTPTPTPLAPTKTFRFDIREPASSLYFVNQRSGWALLGDELYGTRDGGNGWFKVSARPLQNFTKVMFVDESHGWAIQDNWNNEKRSNTVFTTKDGGKSWRKSLDLPTPVGAVSFINNRVGYVSGRWHPIQHTKSGGKVWQELDGIEGMNYVYFTNQNEGWGYGGAIWHTNDGGKTWSQVVPYEQVADLWAAKFISEDNGWILGSGPQLWVTTDGETWRELGSLPTTEGKWTAFDFISSREGWVASEGGAVIHTEDGGSTWQSAASLKQGLTAIKFINELNGFAIDRQGNLLRTTNKGRSWNKILIKKASDQSRSKT